MIYVCNTCGKTIPELNTPGDEVNKDFICPKCSKEVDNLLTTAKAIHLSLASHFKRLL